MYTFTDDINKIICTKDVDPYDVIDQLADISSVWYSLGDALRVDFNDLNSLQHGNESDQVRLSKVIQIWYNSAEKTSWAVVLEAVEGGIIKNQRKGREIREWLAKDPQFTKYMEKPDKFKC